MRISPGESGSAHIPGVASIVRSSLHDGPGIRSVVYLKGCPLQCRWCHSPETQRPGIELLYRPNRCIGCGRCIHACPAGCHSMEAPQPSVTRDKETGRAGPHVFTRASCTGCGSCAAVCPNDALVICGEKRPAADLFNELVRDIAYFRRSGGGVTFSGGECLLYPDYLIEVLKYCAEAGIDTAVETSLAVPWEHIKQVLPDVSRFLVDCKHMNAERHREYTGCGNERILDNLALLAAHHTNIVIRIPLIPSVNDDAENLAAAVKMAYRLYYSAGNPGGGVRGVELLKYNPYGLSKYAELGRQGTAFAREPQGDAEMERLCGIMNDVIGARGFVFFY